MGHVIAYAYCTHAHIAYLRARTPLHHRFNFHILIVAVAWTERTGGKTQPYIVQWTTMLYISIAVACRRFIRRLNVYLLDD